MVGYNSPAIATEGATVTVTALDQYGSVDTRFTGTVTLSSSDSQATLPAAYTYQSSDAGVHSFNVALKTLGTESITAMSGVVSGARTGIVVDDAIWVMSAVGTLSKLNAGGAAVMTGIGSGGTAASCGGSAIDSAGDTWSVSGSANALYFASSMGTGNAEYSGGGLNAPVAVAADGAGSLWVANRDGNSVSEFTNAGAARSPATGYGTSYPASDGLSEPVSVAIDGAGGVWVANRAGSSVTHIFGAATPVVTPVAATAAGTVGVRP